MDFQKFYKAASDGTGGKPGDADGSKTDPKPGSAAPGTGPGGNAGGTPGEPTVADLQKIISDLTAEKDNLAKKLGKASDQVGLFKKWSEQFDASPEDLIKDIAKAKGIKLKFDTGESLSVVDQILNEPDEEKRQKILESLNATKKTEDIIKTAKGEALAELNPILAPLIEAQYKSKYSDWDNLTEVRKAIPTLNKTGGLTNQDVWHLAARGLEMPKAIEAAKKEGRDEFIAELNQKGPQFLESSGVTFGLKKTEGNITLRDILQKRKIPTI